MGDSPMTPSAAADRPRRRRLRPFLTVATVTVLGASAAVGATVASASTGHSDSAPTPAKASASAYRIMAPTSTPIKHVVVLFDENESFDHYFGTYPYATNSDGTTFHAKWGTPKVNGLSSALLNHNANSYNPKRLTHSEALTCDQNHG
jgi:phospholipase C